MIRRAALPLGLVLAALASQGHAPRIASSADTTSRADQAIIFRRVYAPADSIEEWPRGNVRYLMMERNEFDRLLTTVRSSSGGPPWEPAYIHHATYAASLEGDQLVGGTARLEVRYAADEVAVLPLSGCGVALLRPRWADAPEAEVPVGLAADGRLVALVDRSGDLKFDWSLRSQRDAIDGFSFELAFPKCPNGSLLVDVPGDLLLESTNGLVLDDGPLAQQATDSDELPAGPPPSDLALRHQWNVRLGGDARVSLRVRPRASDRSADRFVLLRQTTTYDLRPGSVDVDEEYALDVFHEPLRELRVSLDAALRLTMARLGDTDVPWSEIPQPDLGTTDVVLRFPQPVLGAGRLLRLAAVAPLVLDSPEPLPRIVPDASYWQEGQATLNVDESLELTSLDLDGCRQTGLSRGTAARPQKGLTVQLYRPQARIVAAFSRPPPQLAVMSGTSIELGTTLVTSRLVADFRCTSGSVFRLEGTVPAGWIIDSVDSEPPDVVDYWSLDSSGDGRRELHIRLRESLRPQQQLRLVVSGQHPGKGPAASWDVGSLKLINFERATTQRELVAVRPETPLQLRLSGDSELTRFEPDALNDTDASLVAAQDGDLVFDGATASRRVNVSLSRETPQFDADLEVDAVVVDGRLLETYRIRCAPESSYVDRITSHFSQTRDEPLKWSLTGEGDVALDATRLVAGDEDGDRGEQWEIVLQRPRNMPFELTAERSTEFRQNLPVSLVAVPDSASDRGMLTIRVAGDEPIDIANHRLKVISSQPRSPERHSSARALLRYEASRDVTASLTPAVTISPVADQQDQLLVWAWKCTIDIQVAGSGSIEHVVEYRLENAGGDRVSLKLPERAEFVGASLDGLELPRAATWSPNLLQIPLPAGKRFVRISVRYRRNGKPPGMVQYVKAIAPQISVPVLDTEYRYWLPPQFSAGGGRGADVTATARIVDRLFGPLARQHKFRTAEPDTLHSWPLFASRQWLEPASETADRVVSHLNLALERTDASSGRASSWGDVLTIYSKIVSGLTDSPATLYVDARALDEVGINAESVMAHRAGGGANRNQALDVLQAKGLVLVVFPDSILLTHRTKLAQEFVETLPTSISTAVVASPTTIDHFARIRSADPANWLPVGGWASQPAVPAIPWPAAFDSPLAALAQSGWRVYPAGDSSIEGATLLVVRPASWRTAAWICFLLSLGLGWLLVRWRPGAALMAMAISAALALVAPTLIAPVLSSVLVGMLVATTMAVLWDRRGSACSSSGISAGEVGPAAGLAALFHPWSTLSGWLALCLWGTVAVSTAADDWQDIDRPPDASSVHRVFIPVNDDQQPVGDRVYVPEDLYEALYRRDSASRTAPQGWLLRSALYRGSFDFAPDGSALRILRWTASFTVESLEQDVEVRLPLRRDQANLVDQGGQLDGRPVQMQWSDDEAAILFRVGEPGVHHLELQLQPIIVNQDARRRVDMSIPPLASSRLELNVPAGLSGFELPSAMGAVRADDAVGRITADLGPADHLSVSWPLHADAESTVADVEVEQLMWLKVRPGSVVLDAHFRCRVYQGSLRQVRLLADPRLKILPLAFDQGIADVQVRNGVVESIDLQLEEAVSDEIDLQMRFLLAETSGIGNLLLPRLEAVNVRSTRRWLAVSVDAELEAQLPEQAQLDELAIPEFVQAWGSTDDVPQLAFQNIPAGVTQFHLTVQPLVPRVIADQSLVITCGDRSLDLWYRADIEVSSGYVFQHWFDVPTGFEMDRASVRFEGKQRDLRWSRAPSGRLTVFLEGPELGSHQIEVRGSLPTQTSANIPLPSIRLEQAQLAQNRFIVARREGVFARLENHGELQSVEFPDNIELPKNSRLVEVVDAAEAEVESRLAVQASTPLVRGTQVVSLVHNSDAWVAELACSLEVQDGNLDVLRFDTPVEWSEELEIDEGFEYELIPLPGQNRQRLMVRLPDDVEQPVRFRIRGPLTILAGDRVRAPRIELLDVPELQQFVVVPTHIQAQPIAWNTLWLRRLSLPEGISGWLRSPQRTASYQVFGSPFQAELRSVQQVEGVRRVQLADHRVSWGCDGTTCGVASFYLHPAGEATCQLTLPVDHQLVHATVDGLVAVRKQAGERNWSLMLGPEQLPQRVEVVYTGHVNGNPPRRFEGPIIDGWPVQRTLWTVRGPQTSASWAGRIPGASTRLDLEMSRLLATTRMVDLASSVIAETSPDEIENWYYPWALRLATLRGRINRWNVSAKASGHADAARLAAIDRDQALTAGNLGVQEAHQRAWSTSRTAVDSGDLWMLVGASDQASIHASIDGDRLTFRPGYGAGPSIGFVMRGVLALVILGGTLFVYRSGAPVATVAIETAQRWPHAIGVVFGLAWGMWLSPSLAGWIIVAAFLWGAIRTPGGTGRLGRRVSNILSINVNP